MPAEYLIAGENNETVMAIGHRMKQLQAKAHRLAISGTLEAVSLAARMKMVSPQVHRGVIFTLHHVCAGRDDPFQPNAHLAITPQFLDTAIRTVIQLGWKPVPLDMLPELLSGRDDGTRYAAFTLDDGYRNNLSDALPVFRKHDVPFTVFVTTGFMRRTRTIWWMTLEELLRKCDTIEIGDHEVLKAGTTLEKYVTFDRACDLVDEVGEDRFVHCLDDVARSRDLDPMSIVAREVLSADEVKSFGQDPLVSLGAHTVNHLNLAKVDLDRAMDEMTASADDLEALTGVRPTTVAYPYGGYGAACTREFEAAARCGFKVAVTTRPGMVTLVDTANALALPRVSINGYYQKSRYIKALLTGVPFWFAGAVRQAFELR